MHTFSVLVKPFFVSISFAATITIASAGCANYEDGSLNVPAPRAILCYRSVCDNTTLSYECGNMFGASAAYANGLMIKSDHNGTIFYNKYHRMNGDDWTCEPISPGSCNFFPQRQARDTVPLASELNGPQLLACKFDNGRNIQGVVLFFKLKSYEFGMETAAAKNGMA